MEKGSGQMVGGRYHCILWCDHSTSYLVLLRTAAALWKDIRFTSERHLRYFVGGQK